MFLEWEVYGSIYLHVPLEVKAEHLKKEHSQNYLHVYQH